MAKDPAVLFYTSDFLSGTSFFNHDQKGKYITLLCEQHQLGSIPEEHLIDVCGGLNTDVAKKFIKDSDGTYYNVRMREESDKRRAFCESRRKSIEKRYIRNTYVPSYVLRMENENENENTNAIKDENSILEAFIPVYLKEAFQAFEEMRRSIKKPISKKARKLIVDKLEKLYPKNIEKQIECLNQSTMNCWQGIFEIKKERNEKPRYGYQEVSNEFLADQAKTFLERHKNDDA